MCTFTFIEGTCVYQRVRPLILHRIKISSIKGECFPFLSVCNHEKSVSTQHYITLMYIDSVYEAIVKTPTRTFFVSANFLT